VRERYENLDTAHPLLPWRANKYRTLFKSKGMLSKSDWIQIATTTLGTEYTHIASQVTPMLLTWHIMKIFTKKCSIPHSI
jgi:hypothetical protein